jgi:hypothetical protein
MNLHPSQWLNASGLLISIVGSILLTFATSRLFYDKAAKAFLETTIISYKVPIPPWKIFLGPALLILGFVLQFAAVFLEG